MAKIWHNRIVAGTRTFSEVPMYLKVAVKNLFRRDVQDGVITMADYEHYIGEPYSI